MLTKNNKLCNYRAIIKRKFSIHNQYLLYMYVSNILQRMDSDAN